MGVNRNVGGLHRLGDPAWKHTGRAAAVTERMTCRQGWPATSRQRIYPAPGRRGANERNRRGFAAHTATQEQAHHPRPRSVSFELKWSNGRSITWGRVRMPRSDGPKWNKNWYRLRVIKALHNIRVIFVYSFYLRGYKTTRLRICTDAPSELKAHKNPKKTYMLIQVLFIQSYVSIPSFIRTKVSFYIFLLHFY